MAEMFKVELTLTPLFTPRAGKERVETEEIERLVRGYSRHWEGRGMQALTVKRFVEARDTVAHVEAVWYNPSDDPAKGCIIIPMHTQALQLAKWVKSNMVAPELEGRVGIGISVSWLDPVDDCNAALSLSY